VSSTHSGVVAHLHFKHANDVNESDLKRSMRMYQWTFSRISG